jgi:uncharacterized protein
MSDLHAEPNALIHSTSPYLLQHAYNPVKWFPWGEEALSKAKNENKLLMISIGYSSCHWCHVMERESFEDEEVATVMNKFFVCIKVDREERPDIDQIYMDAVQLMSGSGGWPLNCFVLPDQRPIYGGTYFPRDKWHQILLQLAGLYRTEPDKCNGYAEELMQGIRKMEMIHPAAADENFEMDWNDIFNRWSKQFDEEEGGSLRVPKFPMPDNYKFLLSYWYFSNDESCKAHIQLTLKKMAFGGIYDQLAGGFARYSTDKEWKVPHFEKMLYDNAQLVSLYVNAWQAFKDPMYEEVVHQTLSFVHKEMTSKNGGFYSALDADSEGKEGKYYTWKKSELKELLGADAALFFDYYNVNELGYWEEEQYILLKKNNDEVVAQRNSIEVSELRQRINVMKHILLMEREQRTKPGLDDKIICGWNALMLKGYVDAYLAFEDLNYLMAAEHNAAFILNFLSVSDGGLIRTCMDKGEIGKKTDSIPAFLDDYAFSIDAFVALYQATFNEKYLAQANVWMEYIIRYFSDEQNRYFYFTSSKSESLISRKIDLQDNVIPSANAMMAQNLFLLGRYNENSKYEERAKMMVHPMKENIRRSTQWFSRWAQVMLFFSKPFYEVVVSGADAVKLRQESEKHYLPNTLFAGSISTSDLPLLSNRFVKGETLLYVCRDKVCRLPVKTFTEVLKQIHT